MAKQKTLADLIAQTDKAIAGRGTGPNLYNFKVSKGAPPSKGAAGKAGGRSASKSGEQGHS